jgi:hypothetical protein
VELTADGRAQAVTAIMTRLAARALSGAETILLHQMKPGVTLCKINDEVPPSHALEA